MRRRETRRRRAGDFRRRVVRRLVLRRRFGDFRRRVVARRLVDLRRRVVDLRRAGDFRRRVVDFRRAGDFRRATVLLRVTFLRAMFFAFLLGDFRLRVDFFRLPDGFTMITSFNAMIVALNPPQNEYAY